LPLCRDGHMFLFAVPYSFTIISQLKQENPSSASRKKLHQIKIIRRGFVKEEEEEERDGEGEDNE